MAINKKWLLFGLGAYAVFLVLTLPAERAFTLAAGRISPAVSLVGLDGSWHRGTAAAGRIGPVCLGELQWSLEPLALLAGRLQAKVTARLPDGQGYVAGRFSSSWGKAAVRDLELQLPLAQLNYLWSDSGVRLAGEAAAAVRYLAVAGGMISEAEGTMAWRRAEVLGPQRLELGDLRVVLRTEEDGIAATVSDSGGPLAVDGVLRVASTGSYSFSGALASRDNEATELPGFLRLLGRPDGEGKVAVSFNGKFVQ